MKVSLVFDPQGARLVIEPEHPADKALLTAFGITAVPGALAEVSYGASPFDRYGEDRTSCVRIALKAKPTETRP